MNFWNAVLLIATLNTFVFAGAATAAVSKSQAATSKVETSQNSAPRQRTYQSAQGPIDLDMFERVLSGRLQNSKVHINNIRWSKNPSDYAFYAVTWYLRDATASYVIDFTINGVHNVSCDFILYDHLMQTMVKNCESTSAMVDVGWFIAYVQIGLPVRGRPEDFRPRQ